MLIDWFTIAAQVLNFLILVWLMKRFLYKPIILAIEAREKKIAEELAETCLSLPIWPGMSKKDVLVVVHMIKKFFGV
jgi:dTDP-4-amino-4,6-dideoxygalactose transaminase